MRPASVFLLVFEVSATIWVTVELLGGRAILHVLDLARCARRSYQYARALDAVRAAAVVALRGGGSPEGWGICSLS